MSEFRLSTRTGAIQVSHPGKCLSPMIDRASTPICLDDCHMKRSPHFDVVEKCGNDPRMQKNPPFKFKVISEFAYFPTCFLLRVSIIIRASCSGFLPRASDRMEESTVLLLNIIERIFCIHHFRLRCRRCHSLQLFSYETKFP